MYSVHQANGIGGTGTVNPAELNSQGKITPNHRESAQICADYIQCHLRLTLRDATAPFIAAGDDHKFIK
jgi:hypothetical protein